LIRSALAVACLGLSFALAGCGGGNDTTSPSTGGGSVVKEDLVEGTGATAAAGDTVTVNYVGTFTNGAKFDSSYDRNQPYTFRIGAGEVIAGWDQGVPGMKVGGKRRLTIPPSLAYGSAGRPPTIPGNATLIFEIELLSIAGK
jgi:FKBP-type peptidyl-prolyl cis-trans isomerase FkpA